MKIIITETQLKSIMGVIKENDEYYDKILDLYNEVGLEGMSQYEIEYLKSGGTGELPDEYKQDIAQKEYNNFRENGNNLTMDDWHKIYDIQGIIDRAPGVISYVNNFDGLGFFLDLMCSLVFDYNEDLANELNQLASENFGVMVKKGKLLFPIPKSYLSQLNGIQENQ
jgi:hypothetical protein